MNAEWMQKNAPGLWAADQETRRRDEERRRVVEQAELECQKNRRPPAMDRLYAAYDEALKPLRHTSAQLENEISSLRRNLADAERAEDQQKIYALQDRISWLEPRAKVFSAACALAVKMQREAVEVEPVVA